MRTYPLYFLAFAIAFASVSAEEPMLATPPPGHVLDLAHALLPEAVTRMSDYLLAAERENSLFIYVLTIPSLHTTSAQQKSSLERVATQSAGAWCKNAPGGVIAFDDESGLVTIAFSNEATARFSQLQLEMLMKDALRPTTLTPLDRDNLERVTKAVTEPLKSFQQKANSRSRKITFLIAGAVGLVVFAIGLEWFVASAKRGKSPVSSEKSE